jgi:hypothetical protein
MVPGSQRSRTSSLGVKVLNLTFDVFSRSECLRLISFLERYKVIVISLYLFFIPCNYVVTYIRAFLSRLSRGPIMYLLISTPGMRLSRTSSNWVSAFEGEG